MNELKENKREAWLPMLESFQKLKEIIKANTPHGDHIMASELSLRSLKTIKKPRKADIEFRDASNVWVENTMEEIKNRRNLDKKDPNNMVRRDYAYGLIS